MVLGVVELVAVDNPEAGPGCLPNGWWCTVGLVLARRPGRSQLSDPRAPRAHPDAGSADGRQAPCAGHPRRWRGGHDDTLPRLGSSGKGTAAAYGRS